MSFALPKTANMYIWQLSFISKNQLDNLQQIAVQIAIGSFNRKWKYFKLVSRLLILFFAFLFFIFCKFFFPLYFYTTVLCNVSFTLL